MRRGPNFTLRESGVSVITNLRMELFEALMRSRCHEARQPCGVVSTASGPQTGDGQPSATGQWQPQLTTSTTVLQYLFSTTAKPAAH